MKVLISAALALAFGATASSAAILNVSGPNSSAGTAATQITAPSDITDDAVTNSGQQGFDEKQGVLLDAFGIETDQGFVGNNMRVDSHMIFLNGTGGDLSHFDVLWEFSGEVLGVMSDYDGDLEAASSGLLGNPLTNYTVGTSGGDQVAPYSARGMEGALDGADGPSGPFPLDGYSISGSTLTVGMSVRQPGDWIRVVTVSAVPVPAAMPLLIAGLGGLGFMARRKKRKTA